MVIIAPKDYPETKETNEMKKEFDRFPFPLSPFQKHSIDALVNGKSILVTAHTGSGKTVPAEFAIQYFQERGKKVIYCSPIKALSNQKFYEFRRKYPHIQFGLLTGDNKINPIADCLIMTTEILMNYLFHMQQPKKQKEEKKEEKTKTTPPVTNPQSAIMPNLMEFQIDIENELAAVVFDEVHYINDAERGKVWEKSIMMLPAHVQLILLSATIDGPVAFARWCQGPLEAETQGPLEAETQKAKREIVLCSTSHRIVPLGHYSFLTTTEAAFKKIKDKQIEQEIKKKTNRLLPLQEAGGKFIDTTYHDITKITGYLTKWQVDMKRKFVVNRLLQHLTEEGMTPALLFLFSRKQVETLASEITTNLLEFDSKVPYISRREVEKIMHNSLPNYREYMKIPEYEFLVGLLEKGIGIHHAGMIPIFREIVELFISQRYIKLLIATESFAIGLDCPIKSTIFTGFTKWDGRQDRLLMPHEYTQMAGRAGRRGIDTIGYVIHCNNLFRQPTMQEYKTLLCNKPERFRSKFAISYDLVLNLLQKDVPTNMKDIVDYAERSMVGVELHEEIEKQGVTIEKDTQQLQVMQQQKDSDPVKEEVIRQYILMTETGGNKARKEAERIKAEYPDITTSVTKLQERDKLHAKLRKECDHLCFLETYLQQQIEIACTILEKQGFIALTSEGLDLTQRGQIAKQIREVECRIMTHLLQATDGLRDYGPEDIAALLSCFIEVRDSEVRIKKKESEVKKKDSENEKKENNQQSTLLQAYELMQKAKEEYEKDEDEFPEWDKTTREENNSLQPYLMEPIKEWAKGCKTEEECKYFLQTQLKETLDMSLGDFVKVILKIVAAKKELERVAQEDNRWLHLLNKLQEIEPMVSKFLMTSQSLYLLEPCGFQ